MYSKKVLNRILLGILFFVICTFIFLCKYIVVCPAGASVGLKVCFYFTIIISILLILFAFLISIFCVMKEKFDLIWLIELLNLVSFALLFITLIVFSTTGVAITAEYGIFIIEIFVLNIIDLLWQLIFKSKNIKLEVKELFNSNALEKNENDEENPDNATENTLTPFNYILGSTKKGKIKTKSKKKKIIKNKEKLK